MSILVVDTPEVEKKLKNYLAEQMIDLIVEHIPGVEVCKSRLHLDPKPQLVFLDAEKNDDMNKLINEMKEESPDTKIVMIVDSGHKDLGDMLIEKGADGYLEKPLYNLDIFLEVVKNVDAYNAK